MNAGKPSFGLLNEMVAWIKLINQQFNFRIETEFNAVIELSWNSVKLNGINYSLDSATHFMNNIITV